MKHTYLSMVFFAPVIHAIHHLFRLADHNVGALTITQSSSNQTITQSSNNQSTLHHSYSKAYNAGKKEFKYLKERSSKFKVYTFPNTFLQRDNNGESYTKNKKKQQQNNEAKVHPIKKKDKKKNQ